MTSLNSPIKRERQSYQLNSESSDLSRYSNDVETNPEDIVQAALDEITKTLIDRFFSEISAGERPLRERLGLFFRKGDRERQQSAQTLVPELAPFLNPNKYLVFPSFNIPTQDGLQVGLGANALTMKADADGRSFNIWINLNYPESKAQAFSAGIRLNSDDEVDGAVQESFKVGAVSTGLFSVSPQDLNPDLGLVTYSRKCQAPWSGKKNEGVYRLLADYRLQNEKLEAKLVNVSYGLIDVYGYRWQGDYTVKDNPRLIEKQAFNCEIRNVNRDEQTSGWETCPETVALGSDGLFRIQPEEETHPLLVIGNKIYIKHIVDQMLGFGKKLLPDHS